MNQSDWYQKTTDELYEYFDNLEINEQVSFLIHLFGHYPKLEIPWIELIEDTKDPLLFMHQPEKVEELMDLFTKTFPGEYEKEYEFIEGSLITYYLFTNNIDKVNQRLEIVKKNPAKGIDTVTLKALYQLIYHGHYSTALEYSHAVWKPVYESDDIWGSPHFHFCTTIYLDALEKAYIKITNGNQIDWKEFMTDMEKYDIQEDKKIFQSIHQTLEHPFSKDEFIKLIENRKLEEVNLLLNIHFLKYMKDQFDIPFMLSDRWWNMLSTKKLYKKKNNIDDYFHIPYETLDQHFASHYDTMFRSNDIEMFGKVWGLEYVYHFLKEHKMISEENFGRMNENIRALKYHFTRITDEDLWKMDYIFKWPDLYLPDSSEKEVFQSTFTYNAEDFEDKVDNYLNDHYMVFPERLKQELKIPGYKEWDDEYPQLPYVKESPDIGRNDPCPCGSGKKYKNCCLN
jgi:uncharacterized protein YecA (UPF0149 family)